MLLQFLNFLFQGITNRKGPERVDCIKGTSGRSSKELLEKEELLKSAEISKTQMTSMNSKFEELKHQAADKDSLIKSTQLQLSDAKVFV